MAEPHEGRELALVLPVPPSVNHQYATVNGRRVLSRDGRAYKALVVEEVEAWEQRQELTGSDLAAFGRHYLALTITFYFRTALRRDLDGGLKIAQDALCEALGINDNLVAEIHLSKRVDRLNPRIEVLLTTLPGVELPAAAGRELGLPALPLSRSKRRRRLRKQRSLEELSIRHHWS